MANPPAGWYPDTTNDALLRWWDGAQWTEHYSPREQTQEVQPAVMAPASHRAPAVLDVASAPTPAAPTATASSPLAAQPVVPVPTVYRFPNCTWPNVEVAGESYRENEIVGALGRRPKLNEEIELVVDAALVPEPDNPHDGNAISVRVNGHVVGYLERNEAKEYKPVIHRVAASGLTPLTSARIWAVVREGWDDNPARFFGNVRVALNEPQLLLPMNEPPAAPHSVIPWGGGLQVTGEENHLADLAPFLPASGRGLLVVTLHRGSAEKGRTVTEFAEVRVDGRRVGQMTPATSKHFLPLIDHLEAKGLLTAAWAHIKGSALAAEVTLQAAKASEVDNAWLTGGPVAVPKLVPVASSYRVPNAYVPQRKGPGKPSGGAPASGSRPTQSPKKEPAKAGCGMVAALMAASTTLSIVPEVGPLVGLVTFGLGLAALAGWNRLRGSEAIQS
jgi:Protein of unknown function (DUF2510)/HIRAN domain